MAKYVLLNKKNIQQISVVKHTDRNYASIFAIL